MSFKSIGKQVNEEDSRCDEMTENFILNIKFNF